MTKINLKLQGMSCASCALSIEKEVSKIPGVNSSQVNFATETGNFEFEDNVTEVRVIETIKNLGYSATSIDPSDRSQNIEKDDDNFQKFIISITLSIFTFMLAMWPFMDLPNREVNWWLQLILTLPVWMWIGAKFQRSLLVFLKTGRSGMNTLIGLGTTAAFLYSAFITIFYQYSLEMGLTQLVYFEAVGFIISFVYLGQYFEIKAKKKTKEALNSLFKLSSKTAMKIEGQVVIEMNIDEVRINDLLRVRPGEKFPVDGAVIKGESFVDESMISGESIPVLKKISDKVYAGSINGDSVVDFRATKVGADTFLAQIISYVEMAQNSKPEIQKYADKISSIFTPVVIVISVVTFLSWYFLGGEPRFANAISNFIAVLVIACPCALGLATPTAVVVATGRASLKGLLISGGDILEKASNIDTIIFDKTGTITEGKPTVVETHFKDNDDSILRDIASIEQYSEHPISKAIVKFAIENKLKLSEPDSFKIVKGKGIVASINNNDYLIGNEALLNEYDVKLCEELKPKSVGSFVFVSVDGKHQGSLVIGDKIKPTSKKAITTLKEMGIKTLMITGDNKIIAESVCQELGIDKFYADELPLGKARIVEELIAHGFSVAMVGDGVNDAPALAKATLSMAMGSGSDVAISASDVTIVKGDLGRAVDFLNLSRLTMKIIRQNLFLSLVYNATLIPIAAGVLYIFGGPMLPPILASVAMGLSSISVVSNSLRIRIK